MHPSVLPYETVMISKGNEKVSGRFSDAVAMLGQRALMRTLQFPLMTY